MTRRERIAVLALEKRRHGFIQRVLVIAGPKWAGDRPALGVPDVLGDLTDPLISLHACVEMAAA